MATDRGLKHYARNVKTVMATRVCSIADGQTHPKHRLSQSRQHNRDAHLVWQTLFALEVSSDSLLNMALGNL